MIRLSIGLFGVIASGGVVDSAPLWYIPAIAIPSLLLMVWPLVDGTISD
jgi:hypothetical protein